MNYNSFFNKLAANNSRNFKIAELEACKNDTLLREIIKLALDPFTQFYIRKIPKYTHNALQPIIALQYALSQLFDLSSRTVTGNAAIAHLTDILSSCDPDDAAVIERIIQKDLKCGVSVSTANAVWHGLVHEYPVMLCSQFDQKLVDKIKYPAIVQKKEDGMRFNAIVREGACEFRSRNGKEIQLLGELESEFICLANGMDVVFDGELLVANDDGFCDRQTGNGILNKANKGTIKIDEAKQVHAQLWDMIPYIYFVTGHCPTPYVERFTRLAEKGFPDKIHLVDTHIVKSLEEAQYIFHEYLDNGDEGIILKDGSGEWEDKRAKHQIKFKGELECDLKIVDVEEGTGKYAGMLGAIVCESSDGKLRVNVGSGFNDEHRKTFKKKDLIDRIVAIKYNMRSKNKAGEESLFLPIFVELREDKDVADAIGDIK